METELQTPQETLTVTGPIQAPVDRQRRFYFISRVVTFCLITAAVFTGVGAYLQNTNPLVKDFVAGMLGLANVVTIAYISGSVIDYNSALSGLFSRKAA